MLDLQGPVTYLQHLQGCSVLVQRRQTLSSLAEGRIGVQTALRFRDFRMVCCALHALLTH